jgi:hypothetical protein
LDPRFAGSNPAEDDGFLTVIKNPQLEFLRRGSKAVGPMLYVRFYGMLKNPAEYE